MILDTFFSRESLTEYVSNEIHKLYNCMYFRQFLEVKMSITYRCVSVWAIQIIECKNSYFNLKTKTSTKTKNWNETFSNFSFITFLNDIDSYISIFVSANF